MPRIGAFHHPALGKGSEASTAFRAFLHFNPPARTVLREPGLQFVIMILAIPKDDGEARTVRGADKGEEFDRGGSIIQRGAGNQDDECNEMALGRV